MFANCLLEKGRLPSVSFCKSEERSTALPPSALLCTIQSEGFAAVEACHASRQEEFSMRLVAYSMLVEGMKAQALKAHRDRWNRVRGARYRPF